MEPRTKSQDARTKIKEQGSKNKDQGLHTAHLRFPAFSDNRQQTTDNIFFSIEYSVLSIEII